jgi:hypothetical protein
MRREKKLTNWGTRARKNQWCKGRWQYGGKAMGFGMMLELTTIVNNEGRMEGEATPNRCGVRKRFSLLTSGKKDRVRR